MSWSTAIAEFFKFLNTLMSNPKKQIEKVVAIHDEMHKIVQTTDVERLLILKAHNGGGVIKPTGELYVSVLYEDYEMPFTSVKSAYQKLPVDRAYARMLLEIIEDKKVIYDTVNMEDSLLKSMYELEEVKSSVIHYLHQDKKSVYFVSYASSKDLGDWYDNPTSAALEISSNIIRQNIK